MTDILLRHALPDNPDELPPDARPLAATECDATHPGTGRQVRVRRVVMVSPSQNSTHHLIRVLGPATGEDGVHVPAEGEVEMAQILEMLDMAIENRRKRAAARKLWLPQRHIEFQEGMVRRAHEIIEEQAGRSVFGPFIMRERGS